MVGNESGQGGHIEVILKGTITVIHDNVEEIKVSSGDTNSFVPGHDA